MSNAGTNGVRLDVRRETGEWEDVGWWDPHEGVRMYEAGYTLQTCMNYKTGFVIAGLLTNCNVMLIKE